MNIKGLIKGITIPFVAMTLHIILVSLIQGIPILSMFTLGTFGLYVAVMTFGALIGITIDYNFMTFIFPVIPVLVNNVVFMMGQPITQVIMSLLITGAEFTFLLGLVYGISRMIIKW